MIHTIYPVQKTLLQFYKIWTFYHFYQLYAIWLYYSTHICIHIHRRLPFCRNPLQAEEVLVHTCIEFLLWPSVGCYHFFLHQLIINIYCFFLRLVNALNYHDWILNSQYVSLGCCIFGFFPFVNSYLLIFCWEYYRFAGAVLEGEGERQQGSKRKQVEHWAEPVYQKWGLEAGHYLGCGTGRGVSWAVQVVQVGVPVCWGFLCFQVIA